MSIPMDTVITIQAVTAIAMGIIVFFAKRFINNQDKRWAEQEDYRAVTQNKMTEIEVNYLDRFKDVTNRLTNTESVLRDKVVESERNIINKIMEMQIRILDKSSDNKKGD